jgi:hypothetical protein
MGKIPDGGGQCESKFQTNEDDLLRCHLRAGHDGMHQSNDWEWAEDAPLKTANGDRPPSITGTQTGSRPKGGAGDLERALAKKITGDIWHEWRHGEGSMEYAYMLIAQALAAVRLEGREEALWAVDGIVEELQEIGRGLWSTNAIRGRQINGIAQRLARLRAAKGDGE